VVELTMSGTAKSRPARSYCHSFDVAANGIAAGVGLPKKPTL
jgi:hypothetical protein